MPTQATGKLLAASRGTLVALIDMAAMIATSLTGEPCQVPVTVAVRVSATLNVTLVEEDSAKT